MLLAYDDEGNVIATLDYAVAKDEQGRVTGLIDFEAHELAGGEMTDVWRVEGAKGSKTWPEWIGGKAHDFRVELDGPAGGKRIKALVHVGCPEGRDEKGNVIPAIPPSGHRRERAAIEEVVAGRITAANGEPADLRDLLGGPDRSLLLHDDGTTRPRRQRPPTDPRIPRVRVPSGPGTSPSPPEGPSGPDSPGQGRTPSR